MFGFFNSDNSLRAAMQVTNGLMAAFILSEIINNPETAWENGMSFGLHALNVLVFSRNDNAVSSIGTLVTNGIGLGSIYGWVASGSSSHSVAVHAMDTALYLGSVAASFAFESDDELEQCAEVLQKKLQ